jgi:hypothetical protein
MLNFCDTKKIEKQKVISIIKKNYRLSNNNYQMKNDIPKLELACLVE